MPISRGVLLFQVRAADGHARILVSIQWVMIFARIPSFLTREGISSLKMEINCNNKCLYEWYHFPKLHFFGFYPSTVVGMASCNLQSSDLANVCFVWYRTWSNFQVCVPYKPILAK